MRRSSIPSHRLVAHLQEIIMNILNWIITNASDLIGVATTIVAAASAVAALTPTPKDDTWVAKIYKVVDWLALNVGKAKD